jgi:RNA polymerase sigma-70 factor (ECF subfamily)
MDTLVPVGFVGGLTTGIVLSVLPVFFGVGARNALFERPLARQTGGRVATFRRRLRAVRIVAGVMITGLARAPRATGDPATAVIPVAGPPTAHLLGTAPFTVAAPGGSARDKYVISGAPGGSVAPRFEMELNFLLVDCRWLNRGVWMILRRVRERVAQRGLLGEDGMPEDRAELMRTLYDEHAAPLWRYTLSLVRDPARAEDIVQETLLRAWQRPAVLDQSANSARSWLFTVARHLVVDEYRSARNRRELRTDTPPEQVSPDRSEEVLDSWLVGEGLARLSADHRAVIVCAFYRGMSTRQIAAELEVPEGTVKSRMHYGMRALRAALDEKGVSK